MLHMEALAKLRRSAPHLEFPALHKELFSVDGSWSEASSEEEEETAVEEEEEEEEQLEQRDEAEQDMADGVGGSIGGGGDSGGENLVDAYTWKFEKHKKKKKNSEK